MRLRSEKLLCLGLWLVMAGLSLWGYFHIPDGPVAVHFGLDGTANGFQPRDTALLTMPGIGLAMILLLFWVLPAIMPKNASIDRSAGAYGAVVLSVVALITIIQGTLVLHAAGVPLDIGKVAFSGVGLLFVIIGNYLPKIRKNWIAGIRTPWTLSDERVWDKTHRAAGLWFVIGGLVVLIAGWIAPELWHGPIFIAAILLPSLGSIVYSYLAARKLGLA